jgi:hypothetical protein
LKTLRDAGDLSAAQTELAKALRDRSAYVVARAAEIVGELAIRALAPDLVSAFERFLDDPVKRDPQCLAKAALAEALVQLEHDDREFFLRGLCYVQLEPVWGGSQDSAGVLRGICAFGLVQSGSGDLLDVLNPLADLLADPEKPARVNAARAIAQLSRREGIPLLRLRIQVGDQAPEVIGECFSALLSLSPGDSVPFIAAFLESADADIGLEAAAALGEAREPLAFEALKNCWASHHDPAFKRSLLLSMGLSRQPAAMEFLLSLVQGTSLDVAADALAALAPCRFHAATRDKVEAVLRERGLASLTKTWQKIVEADRK